MTARSQIRDCALELFARNGPDAVTIREIAAAAGVSPPLVLHHFGSKQGLRDAVDAHVEGMFDALLDAPEGGLAAAGDGAPMAAGFFDALMSALPPGSAVPDYLRRLLLSGDPAGRRLFARWFQLSRALLEQLDGTGVTRPTADPDARAAFLMVNDLAMMLMHEHVADALGVDPLSPAGMERWAASAIDAYTSGVFTPPSREEPS